MQDDFDLEGLSKEEARAYVAQFVQSLQMVRKDRAEKEAEFEKWKSRTRLAADRGETELAKEALRRAEEVQSTLPKLKREQAELEFKVTELKRRLQNLQRQPELTVNADALLDQLQTVVGKDHPTNEAITEAEAEVALEELRRKMAAEDGASEQGASEAEGAGDEQGSRNEQDGASEQGASDSAEGDEPT